MSSFTLDRRGVAVVEGNTQIPPCVLDRIEDGAAFGDIGRHGFFRDDVAAELHGADDILVMRAIHRGHDDDIRFLLRDHAAKVPCQVGGNRLRLVSECVLAVVIVHAHRIRVAKGDQPGCPLVEVQDCVAKHERPRSRADQGVAGGFGGICHGRNVLRDLDLRNGCRAQSLDIIAHCSRLSSC